MNDLTNALQGVIRSAARALPKESGEVTRIRQRWQRATPGRTVILADTSGSMSESAGARQKIDHAQEAVDGVMPALADSDVIAFNSTAHSLSVGWRLPLPSGGTNLAGAIELASESYPERTIVISDGRPDSEEDALDAAGRLTGQIDVIYCGPDSDRGAIDFMQRLARVGGGTVIVSDIVRHSTGRPLLTATRQLLALPAPE